jgi:hypothetical protein
MDSSCIATYADRPVRILKLFHLNVIRFQFKGIHSLTWKVVERILNPFLKVLSYFDILSVLL